MKNTQCPECSGNKASTAILCTRGNGCSVREVNCLFCNGTGEVTELQAAWWTKGQEIRTARRNHNMTLREAAQSLGMTMTELSRYEQGKADPNETLARLHEILNKLSTKGALK